MKQLDPDFMEFANIREFIDLLRTRQKTLTRFQKEAKTQTAAKQFGERKEEIDHFIELIQCSNLTVKEKTEGSNNLKPSSRTARKKSKLKPGREPKPETKKSQILCYIRENPKVTAAQVAAALGFQDNSVSAHIHALRESQLVEKEEGLWKAV